jgi:hypothetical protein
MRTKPSKSYEVAIYVTEISGEVLHKYYTSHASIHRVPLYQEFVQPVDTQYSTTYLPLNITLGRILRRATQCILV